VVLHEFAHHLDGLDGEMGGTPPMPDRELAERWETVFQREYQQLVETVRHGGPALIDSYGATSRSEFFAVVTEFFFELPGPLRQWHPDLYELLKAFYRQDPASWSAGS
jgi:Mlc titration factor MtfA (ptsG expression regulator)